METSPVRRPPTIVTWKWKAFAGYRSKFEAEHVNVFARMVRRNVRTPVEVVCITDDAEGITECDRIIPLWDEFANLRSGADRADSVPRHPSCYRRLRMFARDAGDWLGSRIISMDLDCVITGDLTPLVNRKEPFLAWGDTNPTTHYNGGFIMFDAGARPQLYETFRENPQAAIARGKQLRQFGSDQAWIGACLGPNETKITAYDGVLSYRNHVQRYGGRLHPGARIVFFHGAEDPWSPRPQTLPWVRASWR